MNWFSFEFTFQPQGYVPLLWTLAGYCEGPLRASLRQNSSSVHLVYLHKLKKPLERGGVGHFC